MYAGFNEENDLCPECGKGKLYFPKVQNCSCHINAPCSACTSVKLTCPECGWQDDPEPHHDVSVAPGLSMREYAPRPLDATKIDYRAKSHTHFSMIKEGVYPEGTSKSDVEAIVKGTFGGRFVHFGSGKFKYIAYTD